ncbi:MAG TPA: CusA/CzcA family heavy metal efflux RND transporter [Leptospiraceae bacterium]|nr:CusA/CzcA family heavy metal efflux RND transporter [Leptospiraceae bacterium]HNF24065.1 CusA/CzcA family heavy metal efflux RND transporter [Leptospiraceae bacterium]HNM04806.1 CusA/CzcA family heavy metal efflux RND transporter [Leptospiraceae bacterium]HNN05485.1 CusA/CzcA family heavy metal efflux RND transporter [Leptospiraceae bacterium]
MIRRLVSVALEKRILIFAVFIMVCFFGYYSWLQLSVEAYPDIADVSSQVITQLPGRAAEEMEEQITIPLERALNGIPGLSVMRSKSTFGLSIITLVFQDGIEDYWARQRIKERIEGVVLPGGAKPDLDPLTSPIGEVLRYTVESDSLDVRELRELQRWVIIPKLKQVSGVADVTNFGGITTQFQLELDPEKLTQFNISLSQVTETIQKNNINAGGSMLKMGDLGYVVRGIGLIRSLEDLGKIVVTSHKGVPVFLEDLGELKLGVLERKGICGRDEKKDVVSGVVLLLRYQNPSAVLDEIHKKVNELNSGILPASVKIIPYMDRTELVNTTLNTVLKTLLEGIILVTVVLGIFLGNVKGSLISALTIPIALLISFIFMNFTKIPANLLSLGAIDFGIIVDGAIVMMESILKVREENEEGELTLSGIGDTASAVAKPIFFATIIIITAYFPLFAFERVEKKLFTPMAYTIGYALGGALITALILTPGLAFLAYRRPQKIFHNVWLERVTEAYQKRLEKILESPKKVYKFLAFALVLCIVLTAFIGKDYLPELDEGSIWLQVQLPPGISLQKGSEMADDLRKETLKYEEVSYAVTQVGRNDDGTDSWTPSHIEASIGLKPYGEWKNGRTKKDLINDLREHYERIPGYIVSFSQPMIDNVNDKISGAHSELVIKVYGDEFRQTRELTKQVMTVIRNTPGSADVAIDQEPPLPQIQVKIDREASARYSLNAADISDLVETAIGGEAVSNLFLGERKYDITVRYGEKYRNSPEAIGNLTLTTPTGAKIPVSQVADVKLTTGESTITRESNRRHLTVKVNLNGRDLSSFIREAKDNLESQISYDHQKYQIVWGGQLENQERANRKLAVIVPLVIAVMFILLYIAFGNFRQAVLLIMIVPLALLGGLIALILRGMTLNVSSSVGFIALFGVAIQNGVIMVSYLNDLVKQEIPLKEAVITGAVKRLRPILMTAAVAALGLLPASLATGIGSDVQRPLATVIVYGLITGTAITLFVLPVLYYLMEQKSAQSISRNYDQEQAD